MALAKVVWMNEVDRTLQANLALSVAQQPREGGVHANEYAVDCGRDRE
jgi:hypothetical protein